MITDVCFLASLHRAEPRLVAVYDGQGVAGFAHPEVQVGDVSGELMAIERDKSLELGRDETTELG